MTTNSPEPDDFERAAAAVTDVIRAINSDQCGGDGAEFIARLLATVAANLGSTDQLTAARPGSWEAEAVERLVRGTVGWDDEYLMTFRTTPIEVVANVEHELDDLGLFESYGASIDHIGRVLFGDRWDRSRGNLTWDELDEIEDVEELLQALQEADRREYQERLTATIQSRFEQLRSAAALPDHLTVTVRFIDHTGDRTELTEAWSPGLAGQLYQHARETTPLPGSDTAPDWAAGQRYADALLTAGYWPHLRVPELAHYGIPTTEED
jgi:hypothetical protein